MQNEFDSQRPIFFGLSHNAVHARLAVPGLLTTRLCTTISSYYSSIANSNTPLCVHPLHHPPPTTLCFPSHSLDPSFFLRLHLSNLTQCPIPTHEKEKREKFYSPYRLEVAGHAVFKGYIPLMDNPKYP